MKMYRTTIKCETSVAVEAASIAEAYRIIDGVINNCTMISLIEGEDDELNGSPTSVTRGRIQAEV